jgi:hypothetical protein
MSVVREPDKKPWPLWAKGLILTAVFVAGAGGGVWFTHNFRIVPLQETPPAYDTTEYDGTTGVPQTGTVGSTAPSDTTGFRAAPDQVSSTIAAVPVPGTSPQDAVPWGPFSYRFTPGERLHYVLDADIKGSGFELGESSGIDLFMGADLSLETQSVDSWGTGELQLKFDDVDMDGVFMGSPVDFRQAGENARMRMDGQTQVDTSAGQSIAGIPQMEFFRDPIHMTVARDGQVKRVTGAGNIGKLLSPAPMMAPVSFPDTEIPVNTQWESDFNLPVPGLGMPAKARMLNTLKGYMTVNGRKCGVIHQEFLSAQKDGTMLSPESILGEGMQFTMPEFKVAGENMVYFDIESGHLVQADLDLEFLLELGQEFQGAMDLLGSVYEMLDELEGGKPAGKKPEEEESSLLKFGVSIDGSLSLASIDPP